MTSMDGKVALVTGAASGIGRATAIGLARDGATVVLLVRNAERGEQALHDVRAGAPDSRVEALEVVVKRGAQGALSLVAGELHSAPAVPVDVVDTVGAGDAFVAGYLAERVAGGSPAARLALGVTTAAFVCLVPGDWEGPPRREELSLLTDREPVRR
jgi:NAD(P)-dependent dehydrogenase (short-subunit alcohol dehydrogenase family)